MGVVNFLLDKYEGSLGKDVFIFMVKDLFGIVVYEMDLSIKWRIFIVFVGILVFEIVIYNFWG